MPSRTRREAADALVGPIQEVLRCLTDDGFISRGNRAGDYYTAQFQRRIVPLRRRPGLSPIRVRFLTEYMIQESAGRPGWWEAHVVGWVYDVLDGDGKSILAFHWHPHERGRVTWPHLHAYGVSDSVDLHKLHPPTGYVSLGSVVRFLTEDLDVLPRRPDWQAILDRHAEV